MNNPKAGTLWALGLEARGLWIKSVVILPAGQRGEHSDQSKTPGAARGGERGCLSFRVPHRATPTKHPGKAGSGVPTV